MIKLPHQEPIRFVKNLIKKEEKIVVVDCTFPCEPTLGMVFEASAQGSAAFSDNDEKVKVGFLVSLKNVEKIDNFVHREYLIKIEEIFSFGSMKEYSFELTNSSKLFAKGSLTIAIQE